MKIGFLVNQTSLIPDLEAVLCRSHKSSNFNVALIVILDTPGQNNAEMGLFSRLLQSFKVRGYLGTLRRHAFKILSTVEEWFSFGLKGDLIEFSRQNIYETDIPVIRITPLLSPSQRVITINDSDAEYLRSFGMDFFINGIPLILRGKILDLSPMGVIGLHHGDNRKYRGRPSGFWELYKRDKHTGYIFQKLSDQLDNGQILFRDEFSTKSNYIQNVQFLHHIARVNFVDFIDTVFTQTKLPSAVKTNESLGPLYFSPTILQILKYLYIVYVESKITNFIRD